MVYNGPSKGCRKCRARRIKVSWSISPDLTELSRGGQCDQRRPACAKCTTKKTPCPGYGDVFEKAHRDETVKIVRRHSKKSSPTLTRRGPPAPNVNSLQLPLYIPLSLSQDAEYHALGFFFLHYSSNHDPQTTCSFFGILPTMYANSSASSSLSKATRALALQVANLHNLRRDESATEHRIYTEALTQTNQAIAGPTQSKSDELLMTTLVLDAYESNKATFGSTNQVSHFGTHILGSVALLQHRGSLNYRDEMSWRLVIATRNRLLYHNRNGVTEGAGLEGISAVWDGGVMAQLEGVAIEADTLTFKFSRLQHLMKMNYSVRNNADYEAKLRSILSSAINLATECDLWRQNIPLAWKPIPTRGCMLTSSIQAAALYEHAIPTIYTSISIANSLNHQRITELSVLALIHECIVAISAKAAQNQPQTQGKLPNTLLGRVQILVDEVCASVPYLTLDVSEMTSTVSSTLPTPNHNVACLWDTTEHRRQVAASGLYMMYSTLRRVLEVVGDGSMLGGKEDVVREGQVDWMIRQSHRLREVLHL
ncbi:Fc.00g048170.m01.CDS01 [Cosmosporella sp. VM-42]